MSREHLDYEYLKLAYTVAMVNSTDPSTQNGAVIVSEPREEASRPGYFAREFIESANFFPSGVKESEERWTRPLKYKFVEHAERNVIYLAAKVGFKTQGATMYVPWFACADCARAIIQAGIVEVVGHDYPPHKEQSSWKESIEIADQMLLEAGVKFRRIPGNFNIKIRFNGQVVTV